MGYGQHLVGREALVLRPRLSNQRAAKGVRCLSNQMGTPLDATSSRSGRVLGSVGVGSQSQVARVSRGAWERVYCLAMRVS